VIVWPGHPVNQGLSFDDSSTPLPQIGAELGVLGPLIGPKYLQNANTILSGPNVHHFSRISVVLGVAMGNGQLPWVTPPIPIKNGNVKV